ncbi:MAG: NAD(P)H-dependent oxidoreductase, partial [Clostridia bacterium]|nr:NAD(P)H-dependent oxidoreductase [Clostridia bacterium]
LIDILAKDRLLDEAEVEIIALVDYELKPCIGCGGCFSKEACSHDPDFNTIFQKLSGKDAFFIVSAHYAPIPAKLSMLLEKVEQLAFLKRFHDDSYRSPLFRKPVGLVAHGGGTEEIASYYKGPVLDTIWNALSYPVEMDIVSLGDNQPHGVTIPVKTVRKDEGSIFPVQEYDWEDIERRLLPLVVKVLDKAAPSSGFGSLRN